MDHREAMRLVSDWARGRLDAASAREVDAHVRECRECQEAAEAAAGLETASRRVEPASDAHPSSDALARYVEMPDAESIAALAHTGAHVRACRSCREDVELMREAAAPSWRRFLRTWFGDRVWGVRALQPAFAILAVLLAYPAWLGLVEYPRERATSEQRLAEAEALLRAETRPLRGGGISALVLRGATRGEDVVPVLRLRRGQPLQPVLLDAALPPGRVRVSLIREPAGEVWSAEGEREEFWDEANGVVGLLFPADAFEAGEFRIELRAAEDSPPFFTGRFRVAREP
jgi:hypothetical protein